MERLVSRLTHWRGWQLRDLRRTSAASTTVLSSVGTLRQVLRFICLESSTAPMLCIDLNHCAATQIEQAKSLYFILISVSQTLSFIHTNSNNRPHLQQQLQHTARPQHQHTSTITFHCKAAFYQDKPASQTGDTSVWYPAQETPNVSISSTSNPYGEIAAAAY